MRSIKNFINGVAEISPATINTIKQVYGVESTLSDDEIMSMSTYLKIPGTVIDMLECPLDDAAGMADIAGMYSALKSKFNLASAIYAEIQNVCDDAVTAFTKSATNTNTTMHPSLSTLKTTLTRVNALAARASVSMRMLEGI